MVGLFFWIKDTCGVLTVGKDTHGLKCTTVSKIQFYKGVGPLWIMEIPLLSHCKLLLGKCALFSLCVNLI